MKSALLSILLLAALSSPANSEPYLIADRLIPAKLHVLGIAGMYPEGCPSGSVACSNIAVSGIVERVGYVDGEDFPNMVRVRDTKSGAVYSISVPYRALWQSIGRADISWISGWLKPKMRVTVLGTIGGSAGNITMDSIYETAFVAGAR